MKISLSILLVLIFNFSIFSQTTNSLNLEKCIHAAIQAHPLQLKKDLLSQSGALQSQIIDKSLLPVINWNSQARIQSESIALQFDNPNIPSIEIPLYSAQSSLEAKYSIYDGGIRKSQQELLRLETNTLLNQTDISIDKIKAEVVKNYLSFLMLNEKEKVLVNTLNRLGLNIARLESAYTHGLVLKSDVLQMKIKSLELNNNIAAIAIDKSSQLKILESLTGLHIPNSSKLEIPTFESFTIDQTIKKTEMQLFDLGKESLSAKENLIEAKRKPTLFAFASAGVGYPNPLNFFDDNISLFAFGGLGFSWNIIDWGKNQKEKSLIQIQKNILDTQAKNLDIALNRYNERFRLQIKKYNLLIEKELELLKLREEISESQRSRFEKGVILTVEYLSTLNDIIDSKLRLSKYKLDLVKLKLEYNIMKGIL